MMTKNEVSHYDAVVVGAGVTGMYMVYKLQELGFSVRGYDTASDVGGTWYWNRYPGCRLDTESFAYAYFFLAGITPEWTWSERFAGQPELLAYARYAADKMDIRKNIQFNTGVISATFDEPSNIWKLGLGDGSSVTCRFLLTAVGLLSATRLPNIEGIESFKGVAFHTSRWPRDPDGGNEGLPLDIAGKRVAIIGTGATGVQLIPQLAKTAGELYVFQRSPNWCTPLRNGPLSSDEMEKIRAGRNEFLEHLKSTPVGFPYEPYKRNGVDDTPEQREAFLEKLYSTPGYGIWLANYQDIIVNRQTNDFIAEFVANKIRQRVKDPVVAEKLIPKDHPFGSKRIPMETNYYETYNRDNVHLIDIKESPIEKMTPKGIQTTGEEIELDIVIFATGFDAITGSLDRIDIRGKAGVKLADAWEDGPITYLGLQVKGFPNLFTLVGPHNGATFCNVGVCGNLQVEWIADMMIYLRDNGITYVEAKEDAQKKWTDDVYADFEQTLLTQGNAWWVKIKHHADGTTTRRALAYIGGGPRYREICDQVEKQGYAGFELRQTTDA
jgi:cation diffusion facilitator CzcD-associated flavoprotein CzcO